MLSNVIVTTPESASGHNRERARINLARKHRQIANQRAFHYELAHQLDKYDEIRLEDLNLKGMKALWGRKVNLGFADFVKKLVYIGQKRCKNRVHRQVVSFE